MNEIRTLAAGDEQWLAMMVCNGIEDKKLHLDPEMSKGADAFYKQKKRIRNETGHLVPADLTVHMKKGEDDEYDMVNINITLKEGELSKPEELIKAAEALSSRVENAAKSDAYRSQKENEEKKKKKEVGTQGNSSLTGLPGELQQEIYGYLDDRSSARMTRVNTVTRAQMAAVLGITNLLQAGRFMASLKPILDSPDNYPQALPPKLLNSVRAFSRFLAPEEQASLINFAFTEVSEKTQLNADMELLHGFHRTALLGPLLSGQSRIEAARVAKRLDEMVVNNTEDMTISQDEANIKARSAALLDILENLGTAPADVYAPFVEFLAPDKLKYEGVDLIANELELFSEDRGGVLKNMPASVREDVCTAFLQRDVQGARGYQATLIMFALLLDLSPVMQNAVFDKVKEIWESIPEDEQDEKIYMRNNFDVDTQFDSKDLSSELKKKWQNLFAS